MNHYERPLVGHPNSVVTASDVMRANDYRVLSENSHSQMMREEYEHRLDQMLSMLGIETHQNP